MPFSLQAIIVDAFSQVAARHRWGSCRGQAHHDQTRALRSREGRNPLSSRCCPCPLPHAQVKERTFDTTGLHTEMGQMLKHAYQSGEQGGESSTGSALPSIRPASAAHRHTRSPACCRTQSPAGSAATASATWSCPACSAGGMTASEAQPPTSTATAEWTTARRRCRRVVVHTVGCCKRAGLQRHPAPLCPVAIP